MITLKDLFTQTILDRLPVDSGIRIDALERVHTGSSEKRLQLIQADQGFHTSESRPSTVLPIARQYDLASAHPTYAHLGDLMTLLAQDPSQTVHDGLWRIVFRRVRCIGRIRHKHPLVATVSDIQRDLHLEIFRLDHEEEV
jgi:hypothetical protein